MAETTVQSDDVTVYVATGNSTGPLLSVVYQSLYMTISTVGIAGNLVSLIVLLGHAPLRRKPANYFIINQTLIDLMVSVVLIPTTTIDLTSTHGVLACYVWKSRAVFLLMFLASIYNIAALTVERYFKTVHPLRHRVWVTKRRLALAAVTASVAGALLKSPYVFGGVVYRAPNDLCLLQVYPSQTIDAVVGIYNSVVEYFLPLSTIAFCYIQMARSLRRSSRCGGGGGVVVVGQSENSTVSRARRNVIKTLLYVVVAFVVCTTWKQVLILLKSVFRINYDVSGPAFNAAQIMSYSVCCVDPAIYIFHYEEFRLGLRKIFLRKQVVRPAHLVDDDVIASAVGTEEKF